MRVGAQEEQHVELVDGESAPIGELRAEPLRNPVVGHAERLPGERALGDRMFRGVAHRAYSCGQVSQVLRSGPSDSSSSLRCASKCSSSSVSASTSWKRLTPEASLGILFATAAIRSVM